MVFNTTKGYGIYRAGKRRTIFLSIFSQWNVRSEPSGGRSEVSFGDVRGARRASDGDGELNCCKKNPMPEGAGFLGGLSASNGLRL